MKKLNSCGRVFLAAILIAFAATVANAQFKTKGDVVDVLDAKTVVVSVPTGLVTVELQYIDVPESGQSMHDAMKNHVRTLLVGKAVELQYKGIHLGKFMGQLTLDGVDVSQQLLRNGAAWHLASGVSGQKLDEFTAYAESEELARREKRGVWSVPGLEPAWEYREKLKAAANPPTSRMLGKRATDSEEAGGTKKKKSYWSDDNPRMKNTSGLSYGFNAENQAGFVGMALFGVEQSKDTPAGQRTIVDIKYYYWEKGDKGRTGYFQLDVMSISQEKWRFLKQNALTLEIDEKKFFVGKPKREAKESGFEMMEHLTYRLDVGTIEKIVHGGEVKVKVGDYVMVPKPMVQMLLYKLLQAAK